MPGDGPGPVSVVAERFPSNLRHGGDGAEDGRRGGGDGPGAVTVTMETATSMVTGAGETVPTKVAVATPMVPAR
jgi:hypothetical protein